MSHNALSVQRAPADPEQPRRAALVSARQAQDTLNVLLLEGPKIRDFLLRAGRHRVRIRPNRAPGQPLEVVAVDRVP